MNTLRLLPPLVLLGAFAYTCATVARNKGLDPVFWGLAGFLFNMLALVYLLMQPARRR